MNDRLLRVVGVQEAARPRANPIDPNALAEAGRILEDIDRRGEAGVLDHARRFGDLRDGDPVLFGPAELAAARDRLPAAQRDLLQRTADRIRRFAEAQRSCLSDLRTPVNAGEAGHIFIPVASAGCYAPGGRFPLVSSVLMTAVTARAAGVDRVWVASPRPTDAALAAASIAGADGLLAIGGVQAIAALARGFAGVPRCDMIVGPGNRWVTAAKHLVSARVGIDMLAGPSELVVLADATGDPELIAADLLAQAEHDDDAVPILITDHAPLLEAVEASLHDQIATLPTAATARAALRNGFAALTPSMEQAIAVCDCLAPEHLEVMTRGAESVAAQIRHAGAIFIGSRTAEVLGDYGAGPNHVLPTGGTARFRAGLSVLTFLRARTWLRHDDSADGMEMVRDVAALARMERLEGHARAAERRNHRPGVG